MKNINLRVSLAAICVASILGAFTKSVFAEPIRFDQVVQIVDARPAKVQSGSVSTLVVANGYSNPLLADDDNNNQQDNRVITTTKSDIVKDEDCDCIPPPIAHRGFPYWALLGLAAIPIAFIIIHHNESPTPSPTGTPGGGTPTPSPSPGQFSAFAAPCTPATGNVTRIQFIGQLLGVTFLIDGQPVVPDPQGFVTIDPGPHTWAVLRNGVVLASGDVFVEPCNGTTPTPTPTGSPTTPTPTPTGSPTTPTPTPTGTPGMTPTPTPTPTGTPGMTPTPTPTPTGTPGMTPTPTPGMTATPTPPQMTPTPTPPGMTPTPTPPGAVPEPMTILLFGTGLASIGLAARRRFGKKEDGEDETEEN